MNNDLVQAVEQFAALTHGIPDGHLERQWAWQSYDSEGIRFAFFRSYEELRELAARLSQERAVRDEPFTETHLILSQYHTAYWDLQSALLGVSDEIVEKAPAPNGWSVRQVLAHMLGAEVGFYTAVRYALERKRTGDGRPAEPPKEARATLSGMNEDKYRSMVAGPLADLLAGHRAFHNRILRDFADISAAELDVPSTFWEDEPMSIRFRLHRFDSHLRQHTIQLDMTLDAIGQGPKEVKRLLRLVYASLAEVEGALIGAQEIEESRRHELADGIIARGKEIASFGA